LFDIIHIDLQKEIEEFYSEIQEFNTCINASEKIIPQIVAQQISEIIKIPFQKSLSISVELETDSSQILPYLNQILMRKTIPEKFLEIQGNFEEIKRITFKLRRPDLSDEIIPLKTFELIFDKCRNEVEKNKKISRMRELDINLRNKGEALKKKIFPLCR